MCHQPGDILCRGEVFEGSLKENTPGVEPVGERAGAYRHMTEEGVLSHIPGVGSGNRVEGCEPG